MRVNLKLHHQTLNDLYTRTPRITTFYRLFFKHSIGLQTFLFNTKYKISYVIISTDSEMARLFVIVYVNCTAIENPCCLKIDKSLPYLS